MATEEAEYVRKTQEQLGALIKKPPLTDKLLSKPPFRFLHDVIMAVIKQTGFMDGLYQGDEMDAQKVNSDKESKMTFLQKAIDIVQMVNGVALAAKPAKVVAGQEANRTNEFLQALAKAAKKGPNVDAVKRVLKGEKPNLGESGGSAGSNKENRDRSEKKNGEKESKGKEGKEKETKERKTSKERSKEKESKGKDDKEKKDKSKEQEESVKSKEKNKEKEKHKSRSSSKTRDDEQKKDGEEGKKSSIKSASVLERRSSIDQQEGDRKRRSSKSAKSADDKKSEGKSDKRQSSAAAALEGERKKESSANSGEKEHKKRSSSSKRVKEKEKDPEAAGLRIDLGGSAADHKIEEISITEEKQSAEQPVLENGDQEAAPSLKTGGAIVRSNAVRLPSAAGGRPGTASGRPGTAARPAPPRLKRQELTNDVTTNAPMANGIGQSAQEPVKAAVVVETETVKTSQQNDDDDDFIVENRVDTLILNDDEQQAIAEDGAEESGEHGQLVRKILETKKELESQLKAGQMTSEKPMVVFDAQEREKTKKDMGKLQEVVQQLTRTSHPLAKIVDFLQEDVDSMIKELQHWKEEAKRDAELLRQETGVRLANETDIKTLKNKSIELDQQIAEQSEAITMIRGVILNNEQRIQKLMSAIARK